jgi:hypothetical protein
MTVETHSNLGYILHVQLNDLMSIDSITFYILFNKRTVL